MCVWEGETGGDHDPRLDPWCKRHCGYRMYFYHQGNEQTTGGTVEAAKIGNRKGAESSVVLGRNVGIHQQPIGQVNF